MILRGDLEDQETTIDETEGIRIAELIDSIATENTAATEILTDPRIKTRIATATETTAVIGILIDLETKIGIATAIAKEGLEIEVVSNGRTNEETTVVGTIGLVADALSLPGDDVTMTTLQERRRTSQLLNQHQQRLRAVAVRR